MCKSLTVRYQIVWDDVDLGMVVVTVATTSTYSHSRYPPELYSHLASKLLLSTASSIHYIDSINFNYSTVFFSGSSYFAKSNDFTESSDRIEVASFGIPLCSLGRKTPSSPASSDKTGSLSLSLSSFLHSFPNSMGEYRRGMISPAIPEITCATYLPRCWAFLRRLGHRRRVKVDASRSLPTSEKSDDWRFERS